MSLRPPLEAGAGLRLRNVRRVRIAIHSAILLLHLAPSHAADVQVLGGPWSGLLGAAELEAGAGTNFRSPVVSDVLLAVLEISHTGGANWNLKIALVDPGQWPAGVHVLLRRSGGSGEAGLSDGLAWRTLTGDLQSFFSGAGDYPGVEILLRVDGVSVLTPPGGYALNIRYVLEAP